MRELKAGILFDLDGTLLDTAPEFTECLNVILTQAGLAPVTVAGLREHVSLGVRGMLDFGFPCPLSDSERAIHTEHFLSLYQEHLGQWTQPFAGIADLLDWIRSQDMPWGIVTNKPGRFAKPLLQQFPLFCDAGCLVTGDTLPVCKPDPAPLLTACTQLDIAPQASWYVGDGIADVQASRQAGMRCALAHYGYISPQADLQSWGPDHIFKDPKELIGLLAI